MSKPINRTKQRKSYLTLGFIGYLVVLYFFFHLGHLMLLGGEETITIELLSAAFDNCIHQPLELWPVDPEIVGIGAFLGLILPLLFHAEYLRRRDLRPSVESGSAHWNEDLKKYYKSYAEMTTWPPIFDKKKILRKVKSGIMKTNKVISKIPIIGFLYKKIIIPLFSFIFFNRFRRPNISTGSKNMIFSKEIVLSMDTRKTRRNNNILIIGGSGTGKSRFEVKPNMLMANSSFVITDPSGELLEAEGQFLIDQGYELRVFNLVEMEHSHCYNPFHYIRNQEGVLIMINALIKNTTPKGSSSSDPFWEKAETALLQAICFFLVSECNKEDQNFSNVMKLLRCAKAVEGQEDVDSTLDIMFKDLAEREPEHIAVQSYAVFKSAGGGKTAQSILISCQTRLQTFNLDAIKKLTSIDNIDLGSIGDKKVALFCITPSADTTFNYLIALLYTQLFETLYFHAETECRGKRLPHHVRFLLDEFANVGTIPEFSQKLATMRKYEISCTIIIQALSQIKAMYKDDWEVLVGNCDSQIFLGGADATTLEYISKQLGKETISSMNRSRSYGKSGSHSLSYNKTGRELMTPDELRVMDNNNCVIFIRGEHPFFATKFPLEKHPNYPFSGDGNPALQFDVKKMLNTGSALQTSLKVDESKAYKVYKEAQIADTMEADRQDAYNRRPVQQVSARGHQLHKSQPLTREFSHMNVHPRSRTREQQAELDRAAGNISVESIHVPKEGREIYAEHFYEMYGQSDLETTFPPATEEEIAERGED